MGNSSPIRTLLAASLPEHLTGLNSLAALDVPTPTGACFETTLETILPEDGAIKRAESGQYRDRWPVMEGVVGKGAGEKTGDFLVHGKQRQSRARHVVIGDSRYMGLQTEARAHILTGAGAENFLPKEVVIKKKKSR